jgi:phosphatidylserine decarboxylase
METLLRTVLVPIHREGWPFVAAALALALLLALLSAALGWIGLLFALWCAYFFRDPARMTPTRPGLVISPADGVVLEIMAVTPPAELGLGEEPRTRISIFMNAFNVHVNRIPVEGMVARVAYRPGRRFVASLEKASEHNERNSLLIATADGTAVGVVQIAGLVARRIRCWVSDGAVVRAGERFGMIRLGSRVDVFLPAGVQPLVAAGQQALAGETVLADLHSTEAARQAEQR